MFLETAGVLLYETTRKNARKSEKAQRKLMRNYMRAVERANRANETRYQAILGEHTGLYGRTMRGLESVGEAQRQMLREEDRRIQADARQAAVSRGMAGTTVAASLQQAAARQSGIAARALEEENRIRKINADAMLTGQRLGVMERKVEQGPDPNVLRMQMQMAAQPSSRMVAFNRVLDETYRAANTAINAIAAMKGGSPAPPGESPSNYNPYQAAAQTPVGPPAQQQTAVVPAAKQAEPTPPPAQSASQPQDKYYGQSAYELYMQNNRRRRPEFY
jgi:hypothetical protein